MSDTSAPTIFIHQEEDLLAASERVYLAGLFDPDFETSRIQALMDPSLVEGAGILGTWFATLEGETRDVGVAILSAPEGDSNGLPVLNLFVADAYRRKGVGNSLLTEIFRNHPPSRLSAYYTLAAARLYHRFGLAPAMIVSSDLTQASLDTGNIEEAGKIYVEAVLREAQRGLARRPGP